MNKEKNKICRQCLAETESNDNSGKNVDETDLVEAIKLAIEDIDKATFVIEKLVGQVITIGRNKEVFCMIRMERVFFYIKNMKIKFCQMIVNIN